MRYFLIAAACLATGLVPLHADTPLSGDQSGVLDPAFNPYRVVGNIRVPIGAEWVLPAGTVLLMGSSSTFTVDGRLISQGTSVNPVIITSVLGSSGTWGYWNELRFNHSDSSTVLQHTRIRYGKRVVLSNASPTWMNVMISSMSIVAVEADATSQPIGSSNTAAGSAINGIRLANRVVESDVTWPDIGLPYVLHSSYIRVQGSGVLRLPAGIIIKSYLSSLAFVNGGQLVSQGTAQNPVYFTSLYDDSLGGDTNNNGLDNNHGPGTWGGVQFIRAGPGRIENLDIRDAGSGSGYDLYLSTGNYRMIGGLDILGSTLTVQNVFISSSRVGAYADFGSSVTLLSVTLANSSSYGAIVGRASYVAFRDVQNYLRMNHMNAYGLNCHTKAICRLQSTQINGVFYGGIRTESGAQLSIYDSTVTAQAFPVELSADSDNFDLVRSRLQGQTIDTVVRLYGSITSTVTWRSMGLPYVLDGPVTVQGPGRLILPAGTIIKAKEYFTNSGLSVVDGGRLVSEGTPQNPVIFTSIKDDTAGGDTNKNGSSTPPETREWVGLRWINSGPAELKNTHIRFAGSSGGGALVVSGSTLTLTGVMVTSASYSGVTARAGSQVVISSSRITGNQYTGVVAESEAYLRIHYSMLEQNGYGVENHSPSETVDAAYNYWGSPTGPTDNGNPGGTGDRVYGNVRYIPFLISPSGGYTEIDDILPPQTFLDVGSPRDRQTPIIISSQTPIGFNAVDDRTSVGDGQGVGVQSIFYALDHSSFTLYQSSPVVVSTEGLHVFSFYSVDTLGYQSAISSQTVWVDRTPPVSFVEYDPLPYIDTFSRTWISEASWVRYVSTDAVTGIRSIRYSIGHSSSAYFHYYTSPFHVGAGSFTLRVTARDFMGNDEAPRSFEIWVDTHPPVSSIVFSTPPPILGDGSRAITPNTGIGFTSSDYSADGLMTGVKSIHYAVAEGTAAPVYQPYSYLTQLVLPGRYRVFWYGVDQVGNAEMPQQMDLVLSTTALPITTLAVVGPQYRDASSRIYVSSTTRIGFQVDDHGHGTRETRYRLNTGSANTPFQKFISSITLTEGVHTLEAYSVDLFDQTESTRTFSIFGDTTPPLALISISSPSVAMPNGSIAMSSSSAIAWHLSDPVSQTVQSGVKQGLWAYGRNSYTIIPATGTVIVEQGTWTLRWLARDQVDNQVQLSTAILVDVTPPDVNIVFSPEATTNASGHILITPQTQIVINASDALAGLKSVSHRVNSGSDVQDLSAFSLSDLGTQQLQVQAVDRVGNRRQTVPFTVVVSSVVDSGTASDPVSVALPDGTPIIVSPSPIAVPGMPAEPNSPAVIRQVDFSPASPIGAGAFTVTARFSKAMNNAIEPQVSFRAQGASTSIPLVTTRYVADAWTGTARMDPATPSGSAVFVLRGAVDSAGRTVANTVQPFSIQIVSPPAPRNLQVTPEGNRLQLNWQAGDPSPVAIDHYALYRSSTPIQSVSGLLPLQSAIVLTTTVDMPSSSEPMWYYAVSAIGANGAQSAISSHTSVAMPLRPVVTAPQPNTHVDVSSGVVTGLAQPGVVVEVSTASIGGGAVGEPLRSTVAAADGSYRVPLSLPQGTFVLSVRTRSHVTGQTSSRVSIPITILEFPMAPIGLTAQAGDTTITLSWTASSQADIIGYNIYRDGRSQPLNHAPLPNTQIYRDIALTNGRTYRYSITTLRPGGLESMKSNEVSVSPRGGQSW